jgi:hypothetical protein
MPRIVVGCQSDAGWLGQDVDVLLDGRVRARVGRNTRADVAVGAGSHVLQARVGRVISTPLPFRIEERETVGFDCIVSGSWRKSVALTQAYRRQSDERFKSQPGPPGPGEGA